MTFNIQIVDCPIANLFYLDRNSLLRNNKMTMQNALVSSISGMLAVSANLPAVAAATQDLFTVKVMYDCTFYGRD